MTETPQEQNNGIARSLSIPNGSIVSRAVTAAAANIKRRSTCRDSKHYSVSVFYLMATEEDNEIEDELAKAQKTLRKLKSDISKQSKNNFLLERDVRFLDSRIALLIQNRMALDEQSEISSHFDESGVNNGQDGGSYYVDDRKMQQYGNLFFLLQNEPHYMASLCRLVNLSEIDTLLQTVMFTLYGNQYESREENLLLTMFQNVLANQFESVVDFGSLLRANTPVSRMLTTYTRRGPGQTYLKSVLSKKINQLIEQKDLNLQINPLKVYEEVVAKMESEDDLPPGFSKSVTPDVAATNPAVQSLIGPRLEKLMEIANTFFTTIVESLDQVPYGIRWVCKQIRSLTKRKYPEATESSISSLIGGFFFLRFINPAIVTPQAYMLIETLPGSNPRITLTLIAKMLQNLANKPSYSKEAYMAPTNPFVKGNKQRINQFLNDLCEVSDFYETLEMDQYMALSRRDIHINITPNELYKTHEIIHTHVDQLAPDYTNHLRILLNGLGPAPKQIPRKFNQPIQLPLFGRWNHSITNISEAPDSNITQNDILYMETKSLFVQIVRSLPSKIISWDLASIIEAASSANDAQIVTKSIKAQSMLQDLEEAGVVSRVNNYELLMQEIKLEFIQLSDLRKRVVLEINSLKKVHDNIENHTNYLQSQLDSYRAYLKNVRQQSTSIRKHKTNNFKKSALADMIKTSTSCTNVTQDSIGIPQSHQQLKSIFNIQGNGKNPKSAQISRPVSPTAIFKSMSNKRKTINSAPFKFSHHQLEKDGIIIHSEVPDNRRANIYLTIQSPATGAFIISLHYKGREKPILEIELKLDDLLEKQKEHVQFLDLNYVKISVSKVLQLLNKSFKVKNTSRLGFF